MIVESLRRSPIASILLLVCLLLSATNPVRAQFKPVADPESIIRASFEAWAAGTGGPYDLLAEDVVWTITGRSLASRTYETREAFMSEVIRPFNARMREGLKPKITHLYVDGNTVIVHFDAAGVAKDGQRYTNTYAWFLDVEDGRIVRSVAFFDAVAFNDLWTRVRPTQ